MKTFLTKLNFFNFSQFILLLICLTSAWGAIVYKIYKLNWLGIVISLILVIFSLFILPYFGIKFNASDDIKNPKPSFFSIWTFGYLLLLTICFGYLFFGRTSQSIITPWQSISSLFFPFYLFTTFYLILLIIKDKANIYFLVFHFLLSFSVIWLVYKIGYGYDFFVHQATLDRIEKNGEILPKPFYYLGQYSLLIITHKLTGVPLVWLNRLLVPVLAALYLPSFIYRSIEQENKNKLLLILFLLILPFSFLTFSTPQNFSYLLLLLAILYSLKTKTAGEYFFVGMLALTALSIHPIAGLPAIFFVAVFLLFKNNKIKFKKLWLSILFLLNTLSLPVAFYFVSGSKLTFNNFNFKNLFDFLPKFNLPNQENIILNFIYFFSSNQGLFMILFIIGCFLIYHKYKEECKNYWPYILMAISLFASYLLAKIVSFDYLIDYERQDFTDRIMLEAILFLFPLFLVLINFFLQRISVQEKIIKYSLLVFISSLITTSLYLSYPRVDKYFNSRGLSTGIYDIEAVDWINNNAKNNYIVLANQQVSAAALYEFGFSEYYNDIFYYPVPTGGPLYKYYLDMVYKTPSKDIFDQAFALTGVNEGYFVLNRYWWAFPKILEEAKYRADSWQAFGNGQVYVFKYTR